MKKMKKLLALLLALVMAASLAACGPSEESDPTGSPAASGQPEQSQQVTASEDGVVAPITPEELGSGTVKWSEEKTADGWYKVTNQGGATLGYSKDSGVSLIQVDGFAFKDLDRDLSLIHI